MRESASAPIPYAQERFLYASLDEHKGLLCHQVLVVGASTAHSWLTTRCYSNIMVPLTKSSQKEKNDSRLTALLQHVEIGCSMEHETNGNHMIALVIGKYICVG